MALLDNIDFLKGVIKPYIPKITNEFLPYVNSELAATLYKEDENLQEDEKESVFMIYRDDKDVYISVVQLDENARVVRSSGKRRVTDYLASIINQALK